MSKTPETDKAWADGEYMQEACERMELQRDSSRRIAERAVDALARLASKAGSKEKPIPLPWRRRKS